MMGEEKRRIDDGVLIGVGALVIVLGIIARFLMRDFISYDAKICLLPWYDKILEGGGIASLSAQVGNYNIPYQFAIALMTYLPIKPLYAIKALSCIFDVALAASAVFLYRSVASRATTGRCVLVFAVLFALPTVCLNSAAWGQCDAIYATFVFLAVAFVFRKHPYAAALMLGFALAAKLQTVFVFPFFFIWWVRAEEKPNIVLLALLVFVGLYVPCIPGFLMGRSLLDPVYVYLQQTVWYPHMTMNFPNLWGLVDVDYGTFKWPAIALTGLLVLIALFMVLRFKIDVSRPRFGYLMLLWTVWAVLFSLPALHDRYGFVLTALVVVATFVDRRFIPFAVILEFQDLIVYQAFLGDPTGENGITVIPIPVLSAVFILAGIVYTVMMLRDMRGAGAFDVSTGSSK